MVAAGDETISCREPRERLLRLCADRSEDLGGALEIFVDRSRAGVDPRCLRQGLGQDPPQLARLDESRGGRNEVEQVPRRATWGSRAVHLRVPRRLVEDLHGLLLTPRLGKDACTKGESVRK